MRPEAERYLKDRSRQKERLAAARAFGVDEAIDLAGAKATQAVDALEVIYAEEVAHVAYGSKWFHFLCGRHELDPKEAFHDLVRTYFHGVLKPPFNEEKRAEAGIPPDFYWPLTESV